ncbi:MAG: response regulator [Anaerolineales bacterium]|nr:response regulator [Anaerolineales bacterium]
MKSLIVEDDFASRLLMQNFLLPHGESHVAINGKEAITAFSIAINSSEPYQLVCLDIMMPEMDGQTALKEIRTIEESRGIMLGDGVKIIMTTALSDIDNKIKAVNEFCDGYLVKPIDRSKLLELIRSFGLIS